MELLKENLSWIIVVIALSIKGFIDYSDRVDGLFKKTKERKREKRREEVEEIIQ